MNSDHPAHVRRETARRLARRALFGFIVTFVLARVFVFLIMARLIHNLYFFVGHTHVHVHHLNYDPAAAIGCVCVPGGGGGHAGCAAARDPHAPWTSAETWRLSLQGITSPDRTGIILQALKQNLNQFIAAYCAVNPKG